MNGKDELTTRLHYSMNFPKMNCQVFDIFIQTKARDETKLPSLKWEIGGRGTNGQLGILSQPATSAQHPLGKIHAHTDNVTIPQGNAHTTNAAAYVEYELMVYWQSTQFSELAPIE